MSDEAPKPGGQMASIPTIEGYPDVVAVAPQRDSEYVCPSCEASIPTRKQIRLAKPMKYEAALNDVLKCPFCNFLFSPKAINVLRE